MSVKIKIFVQKAFITILSLMFVVLLNYKMASATTGEIGMINVFTYNEHKGDGVFNQQDYGMEGWNICIQKKGKAEENCKASDENGNAEWTELPSGRYEVSEKLTETQNEAGWFVNEPTNNTPYEADVKDDETHYFWLDQPVEKAIFGNRLAEVHGHVTYDQNNDGATQLSEPLLGRWQIYLDLNGNGQIDNPQEWHGCTNAGKMSDCLPNGEEPYLCSNLVDGSWHMRQIPRGTYTARLTLEEGWEITGAESHTLSVNGSSGVFWSDFVVAKTDGTVPSDEELLGTCTDYSDTYRLSKQIPTPTIEPASTPTPEPTPTPKPFYLSLLEKILNLRNLIFSK